MDAKPIPMPAGTANRYQSRLALVHAAKESVQKFWDALIEIKEDRLFLHQYQTWAEFCQAELNFTPQHTNRLLSAAKDLKALPAPVTEEAPPKSKPDAAPPGTPTATVAKPVSSSPTSEHNVHFAGQSVEVKKEILDDTGYPIPEELHALWERRAEVKEMMGAITTMEKTALAQQASDDPLFRTLRFGEFVAQCRNNHMLLRAAVPYAVCVHCQGRGRAGCSACHHRGFLSKLVYESTSSDILAVRNKNAA